MARIWDGGFDERWLTKKKVEAALISGAISWGRTTTRAATAASARARSPWGAVVVGVDILPSGRRPCGLLLTRLCFPSLLVRLPISLHSISLLVLEISSLF
jgi:hypothetical protein